MALTTLAAAEITQAIQASRKLLRDLKPIMDELNALYNAVGGLSSTITQADLDAATYLSGLTKAQLDDGMNTLTNTVRTAIANGYTGLAELAARG